jgi:molybdopterin-guanine dinucleotide biosynthesis protein A
MKSLTGLVLCGGKSSRMGTDKGLLKISSKTWAQHTFDKLSQVCKTVYISINPAQLPFYMEVFKPVSLLTDSVSVQGPLTGLLSFHHLFPEENVLLLACDMPYLTVDTLRLLSDKFYYDDTNHNFYAFHASGFLEPLCGIYTALGLSKVYQDYQSHNLTSFGLKELFKNYPSLTIPHPNSEDFQNCNSPEDI